MYALFLIYYLIYSVIANEIWNLLKAILSFLCIELSPLN